MSLDAFVQVAVDSTGKKVAMDQTVDAGGNTVYLQKALLIGQPADDLSVIVQTQKQILSVLRALLAIASSQSNTEIEESDFETPP